MTAAGAHRCSVALGALVVVVVSAATAIGMIHHFLAIDGSPYRLLSQEVGRHPVWSLLIVMACLAVYGAGFRWLCGWVDRWRDGADPAAAQAPWTGRIAWLTEWVFSRWYRASAALTLAWSPWIISSFPGQPNPDFARMIGEFLLRRSDFNDRVTAPYEAYPTSYYLLPDGERLWSNHHDFFLMLYYGAVSKISIAGFGSLLPGIVVLSAVSLVFTLIAFGRAFAILGRLVPSWKVRALAFGLVAASPLIAMWSMSHTKNHLFAAAFVWWLALIARYVHSPDPVGRAWCVETVLVSLVIASTVLFGWILLVAQAVVMLGVRRGRFAALAVMGLPGLLVSGSIAAAVATGVVIPSDPIETKGVQLQQLALILKEHPDALSAADRAALSKIFDLQAMAEAFDPDMSDPVKSTGPYATKTDSFKYRTVRPQDWEPFTGIWLRAGLEHPATFMDGFVMKSYRYLDPFDRGTNWYPPWSGDYQRTVGEHVLAPVEFNRTPRTAVREVAYHCYGLAVCRPVLSHALRTVVVVMLCAAAVATRRRFAWLWATPFALLVGIMVMSPLSAGGRYALGFTYGLAIVIMLMAIPDRHRPAPAPAGETRPGDHGPRTASDTPRS